MRRWWPIMVAVGLVLAALDRPSWTAEKEAPAKKAAALKKKDTAKETETDKKVPITLPAACAMEEVPAFGKEALEGRPEFRYPRGPFVRCSPEPSKQVKAYPKLKSKQPLYGSLTVDASPLDPSAGKTYFFVLDESGEIQKKAAEQEEPEAKKAAEKAQKPSIGGALARALRPKTPTPTDVPKHDRLYFDLDGDRDLGNDAVLELAKESPFEGLPRVGLAVFQDLNLPVDYGPPHGTRPFRIVPWLASVSRGGGAIVCFAPAVARRGKIRLGGQEYTAYLSQSSLLTGRFDRPFVQFALAPVAGAPGSSGQTRILGYGPDPFAPDAPSTRAPIPIRPGMLGEIRQLDGKYITVSATPLGDKLTIQPYAGDLGVLEVGPGGRAITELGLTGSLVSKTGGSLPVGESTPIPAEALQRRYDLPVGDYFPSSLTVQYGRLRFNSRTLTDPTPRSPEQPRKGPEFGIRIRKDKPYLLEFSGRPAVKFLPFAVTSADSPGGRTMVPTEDQSSKPFKPGDQVRISAMLTEPFQGIMITGLYDTTQKTREVKYRIGDKELIVPQFARLDPSVVIRDSEGKQVAEGKMPFG